MGYTVVSLAMLSSVTVFQYLAAVNKSSSNLITEQILEASPLLESFGNAKTQVG